MIRRRKDVVQHAPAFANAVLPLVSLPVSRAPRPLWQKIALASTGGVALLLLARLDYGTGKQVATKPPREMAPVEISAPPPLPPKAPEPQQIQVIQPQVATQEVASIPSIGLLQESSPGGAGQGTPGPALDLGMASGKGGMGVVTGGGGHGGGTGTGVGSGSGTSTASRFVYNPGETDTDPRVVTSGDPAYPRRAREDGVEPRVELRILVDERGRVEQVEVMGAPAGYGFEAVLRTAVQQWRFQPATKGGVPVRTWVSQGYQFRLN